MTLLGRAVVNSLFWGFVKNQEVHKLDLPIKLVQRAIT